MANLPGRLESNNTAVVVGPRLGHGRLAKSGVETLSQVLQVLLVAIPRCEAWNADHGFASSKELARDILQRVHGAVVSVTDFGVPHDLRLAFCNDRYNDGIDRLREYFTTSNPDGRSMSASGAEA